MSEKKGDMEFTTVEERKTGDHTVRVGRWKKHTLTFSKAIFGMKQFNQPALNLWIRLGGFEELTTVICIHEVANVGK